MKLSEGVEWGLHCVSVLAGLPPGATFPTNALAHYHGLSETYLIGQMGSSSFQKKRRNFYEIKRNALLLRPIPSDGL
jgi:hypothetical protein